MLQRLYDDNISVPTLFPAMKSMVSQKHFTGTKTPAVGFSIGFYSTVMLMMEKNLKSENKKLALIYNKDSGADEVMDSKIKLIDRGFEVSIFEFPKNFNNFAEKLKQNGINKIVKIADLDKIIKL